MKRMFFLTVSGVLTASITCRASAIESQHLRVRVGGEIGKAAENCTARFRSAPFDSLPWLRADLTGEKVSPNDTVFGHVMRRPYKEYSGDISGRFIEIMALDSEGDKGIHPALAELLATVPRQQRTGGYFCASGEIDWQKPLDSIEDGSPVGNRMLPALWGNSRMLCGLVEALRAFPADKAIAQSARDLGAFYLSVMPRFNDPSRIEEYKRTGTYASGYVTCWFPAMEGLVRLSKLTGEKKYLDAAGKIADFYQQFDRIPVDHAHGMLCCQVALLDLYEATKDASYLKRVEQRWDALVRGGYINPAGGILEKCHVSLPRCVDEGCALADWLRLNLALGRVTGKDRYWAMAERTLHNHLLQNQTTKGGFGHRRVLCDQDGVWGFSKETQESTWCCTYHGELGFIILRDHLLSRTDASLSVAFALDFIATNATGTTVSSIRSNLRVGEVMRQRISLAGQPATVVRVRQPHWADGVTAVDPEGKRLESEVRDGWCVTKYPVTDVEFVYTGGVYVEDRRCTRLRAGPEKGKPYVIGYGPKIMAAEGTTGPAPGWPTTIEALKAIGFEPFATSLRGKDCRFVVEAASQGHEQENRLPVPTSDQILSTLNLGHPRIMADAKTFDAIKGAVTQGGLSEQLYSAVKASADKTLVAPVSIYEKPDGRRLLSVSRRVLDRVSELALVSRVEKDARYADRAWKELAAAARFPDWNPAHFLDTAEMTHAFALGYDWLYDHWSAEQRRILENAILEKGLKEGLKVYGSKKGWPKNNNNWNQVCNGGLLSGALAIGDVEPRVASHVVWEAVQSMPLPMRHYEPDGAGSEGVTYWSYAARYNVVLLASLQTALGTDFGLSQAGAFAASGYYQIYMSGAHRLAFDFADCTRMAVSTPEHFWLARQYNVPAFSWFRLSALETLKNGSGGLWDLLWLDTRGKAFDVKALPLDKHFRGAECASLRTSWAEDALIVGIQAGDTLNLGFHRHLDLGSFIVDALGERWITDSGKDHETYMGHQHHNPRDAYYRIRAEGHNVPVLNPGKEADQNPKAAVTITGFTSAPQQAVAVVDLTQAYQPQASRVVRTFTLQDRKRLLVTDEITAIKPSELWWFLHTEAQVKLDDENRTATLTQKGKHFTIRLVEPQDAAFAVMACEPLPTSPNPEKQASNKDRQKLSLHLKGVQTTRVHVVMEPVVAPQT